MPVPAYTEGTGMKRPAVFVTVLVAMAALLTVGATPAAAATLDGTCLASITLTFTPAATEPLPPPATGPATVSTGSGTITTCVFPGGGATTGTLSYTLSGNLTCLSVQNITGTLDVAWADGTATHATVTGLVMDLGAVGGAAGLTATITTGRFAGDQIQVANVRDPLALVACLTTGLSSATGTTSLTFTQPL
jgi:hypothetical protein